MNFRRVKAVSYKEFIHLFRDPRSLLIIIFIPLLLLILFGYALKLDVENVAIAIIDNDKSKDSREYIAKFKSSYAFDVKYIASTYKYAEHLMNTDKIKAFIVIKNGFGKNISNGSKANVQAVVDGSDVSTASSIINYISGITLLYNDVVIEKISKTNTGYVSMGVAIPELRFWFNEEMRSVNYLFPGLVAIIMSVVAGFLTSLTISKEWENGTMEQLIPTPLTEWELIIGKLFTYFVIGFIDIVLYLFMGEFVFHVPLKGSATLTLFFGTLFLFSMLSFGIFISTAMKSQLASSQITSLATMLPAFLLSGFIFDIANMPYIIQLITYAFPAKYFVTILRGIYLKGVGFEYLYLNGVFLLIYSIIMLLLCRLKLRMRA